MRTRRPVLPSSPVGIGCETIAKILLCGDLLKSPRDSRPGIWIHSRLRNITRRGIERPLDRGVSMPLLYCRHRLASYSAGVRFLTHAPEVISAPSSGRVTAFGGRLFLCWLWCRRANTNNLARNKRVGWIYDYFVRFSDTTQDFGLCAKVSPNLNVPEFHDVIGVHYGDLKTFAAKYERIVG